MVGEVCNISGEPRPVPARGSNKEVGFVVVSCEMGEYLLFVVLFILCWPIALLALVVYPVVWLLLLPFRLVGIAVEGVFQFLRAPNE